VLVSFLVVVLLVVDGVIERETVHVAIDTSSDYLCIVVGDGNVLDVVRK
jgi:hypothetical protein